MKLSAEFVATPIQIESEAQITANKELFAELLLKDSNAFRCALAIYPDDTSKALRIANEWVKDPVVLQIQKELIENDGEMAYVATKAEQAKLAWTLANREDMDPNDRASRVKALELMGKLTGTIERPVTAIQNNVSVDNRRVMIVKDHGTDEEWEAKLKKQQKALVNGDYSKH